MTDRPVLYKYFEDTADVLLAEYTRSKTQKSSNNKGKNREYFCEKFLDKNLPPKLYLKSGEIWDSYNNKTGQLDIVIIRSDSPSLEIGSDNIYLAEGVFGVIEVKSNLSSDKLVEAGESLSKVKSLKTNITSSISISKTLYRPLRIIFSYDGMNFETVEKTILDNNWDDLFDLVCILNKGILIRKGRLIEWDNNEIFLVINGKAPCLGFLYFYLTQYSNNFLAQNFKLSQYFEPFKNWQ